MENEGETIRLEVAAAEAGTRLDRFLPSALEKKGQSISRAALQKWIKDGAVRVSGRVVKPRHAVLEGETVEVIIPQERPIELQAEEIDITVLFEDEDIIVVDKQSGLVVHPASGNADGTLVNALLHHCQGKLCELAGEDRPGIVHRLDKDTSGCLVAAKSERAYRALVAQFSGRETGKEYLAVTQGVPREQAGRIENRIGRHPVNRQKMAVVPAPGGKEAITEYAVLRAGDLEKWALLSCVIHTGRTHQIRVHLKECLHTPILGDVIYGQPSRQKVKSERLLLHAWKLAIRHPATNEAMQFEAPVPEAIAPFLPVGEMG